MNKEDYKKFKEDLYPLGMKCYLIFTSVKVILHDSDGIKVAWVDGDYHDKFIKNEDIQTLLSRGHV